MLRPSAFLLAALLCGGISTSFAASSLSIGGSNTPATPPPAARPRTRGPAFKDPTTNTTGQTDETLRTYLTGSQRSDFDDALKTVKEANRIITSANNVISRPGDAKGGFDTNATEARTRAYDDIAKAQKMLTDVAPALQNLRKVAMDSMGKTKNQIKETASAVYPIVTGQWPALVKSMTENVYDSLASQGYKRFYLIGVYALDGSKYVEKPAASDKVREVLVSADKDKFLFLPKQNWKFRFSTENNRPIIAYAERSTNQQGNIKAAVILGEVIFDPNSGYAAFALRAMDLDSWKVVANESAMLSVEPTFGKMLDLGPLNVPSKPITLGADEKPPVALSITAQDPSNAIGKAKESGAPIRVGSASTSNTVENRFAVFAVKSYLSDQMDVGVSDADLLAMILSPDQPDTFANTGWLVPDLTNMETPTIETGFGTKSGDKFYPIVKINIDRTLPKLSGPSAADLRSGGYVIGSSSK